MTSVRKASQTIAPQPSTARGSPVHLSVDPKGQRIAYAAGKAIYLRDLTDPSQSLQYTGHTHQTTVAKFSPSGYYVASADVAGNVKIWSCDTDEPVLKNEVKVIGGKITDLAWDPESTRIIAVGEGKDKWGAAFTMDSGNTVGEISGHSAVPNAVALKGQRPFRAATAGDDCNVVFYHGAPYKYNKSSRKHSKFVYDVKFSPDGSKLASVGADGRVFLYDGKTGDDLFELTLPQTAHSGSIFAISWDSSSQRLVTSSADQTVKLWDVEQKSLVKTWDLNEGGTVNGQQVGNVWTEEHIVSLSLSGRLTYLSLDADNPVRVVLGHQKTITALTAYDHALISGSYDSSAYLWSTGAKAEAKVLEGNAHSGQVLDIAACSTFAASIGLDDTLRLIRNGRYTDAISITGQAKGVGMLDNEQVVVATQNSIILYVSGAKSNDIKTDYNITACTALSKLLVVGADDCSVHVFDEALKEKLCLKANRAVITALAISSDTKLVAVGDSAGKIILYNLSNGETVTTRWAFHVARIAGLSFSPSNDKVVSASLDTHVYVWSVNNPVKKIAIKNAHQGGATGCAWLNDDQAVSSGSDGALKVWSELQV